MKGRITDRTPEDRAAGLAGALAERGVGEVTLIVAGQTHTLRAREADLPGALRDALGAGGGLLSAAQPRLRVRIEADGCTWETEDPELAALLTDISDA